MIVTVTFNPAVDQTVQLDEPMVPNRVLRATDSQFDAGGKGINVSRFLTALGTETVATGFTGGFTGRFIHDDMADDDVHCDFVDIPEPTRLNITAHANGEEYKLNQTGPSVDPALVDDIVETVRVHDPDRVLVGGSLPPGIGVSSIDRIARSGDWRTTADVEGHLLRRLSERYEICKPNRPELADATGADVSTLSGCAEAATTMLDSGFERVVASLGGDGALIASPDGVIFAEALDVEAVDTVGAGDALLSGVLSSLQRGEDEATALRYGVAVATCVISQAGPGVTNFEDVETYRDRVQIREL